jgi:tetratricopeptide (TPR) repeat protein
MFKSTIDLTMLKQISSKDKLMIPCQLFTNRSLCYYAVEDHPKAITDAEYVIANLDPKNAKAYFRKGMSQSKLGDIEGAKQSLERALKEEPSSDLFAKELKALKDLSKKKK